MSKIYVVTSSNGTPPMATSSLEAAKAKARGRLPVACFTGTPINGEWYGYASRSDLYADKDGAAPHLITAVVHRIRDPQRAIDNEEFPRETLAAIREAIS